MAVREKTSPTPRHHNEEPSGTRITGIPVEEKLQSVRVGFEPEDFWREPNEKVKRESRTISPGPLAGEAAAQPGAPQFKRSRENSLFSLAREI